MEVSVVERDYKPEAFVHVHIRIDCGMYNIYKSETYVWPNHCLITSKLGHIQHSNYTTCVLLHTTAPLAIPSQMTRLRTL